jgi:hypothetical protein
VAVHLRENRPNLSASVYSPDAADLGAEMSEEERTVRLERDTIWARAFRQIGGFTQIENLVPVWTQMRNSTAPISSENIARGGREHAFWAREAMTDERNVIKADHRIRNWRRSVVWIVVCVMEQRESGSPWPSDKSPPRWHNCVGTRGLRSPRERL